MSVHQKQRTPSEISISNVHSQCFIRIHALTGEIEKLTQALTEKAEESDQLSQAQKTLLRENQELKKDQARVQKEFLNVCERLKTKTIEAEELKSQLTRIQQFTLKDYEHKINLLVDEIGQLTTVLTDKEIELKKSREQFYLKTEQLNSALQQQFHLENQVKKIKEDKLEYMHHFQEKSQEVLGFENQVKELLEYKEKYNNIVIDIDIIRKNYSELYEEREQERAKLLEQIDIQRQMTSLTNEDLHEKYTLFARSEVEKVKKEQESKVLAVTAKLENNLNTLQTLLETKTLQLEQVLMTRDTMEKTYNYAVIDDVHAREDLIMELKAKNEALQEIFDQTNQELKNWTTQLMTGQILNMEAKVAIEQNSNELIGVNDQLKKERSILAEQIRMLEQQMNLMKSHQYGIENELKTKDEIIEDLKHQLDENYFQSLQAEQEKINYLLKMLESKEEIIKQKDNIIKEFSNNSNNNISNNNIPSRRSQIKKESDKPSVRPTQRDQYFHLNE